MEWWDSLRDIALLELAEISRRVPEAIWMIHPQAGSFFLRKKPKNELVGSLENLGEFNADRRQFIDIEKPAVVDLFAGVSPEGEAIGLRFNQSVQQIKALRLTHRAVKLSQSHVNGASHLRICLKKRGNAPLDNLFLPFTFFQLFRIHLGARRKIADSG